MLISGKGTVHQRKQGGLQSISADQHGGEGYSVLLSFQRRFKLNTFKNV